MTLQPATREDLCATLKAAGERGETVAFFDLSALSAIVQHTPEDMTVAVEAGLSLAALQESLRSRGQWLPIDPPNPDKLSIGALLAGNPSGPRRFGYGTVREHLIGIKVAMADGSLIKAGGNVVKNVAGYDLCKLFVGSRGTLGCIVEATFKLLPLSEAEVFVKASVKSLQEAEDLLERTLKSAIAPIALDLTDQTDDGRLALITGLAGSRVEVEWQREQAAALGFTSEADLSHEDAFWASSDDVHTLSVLPSRLTETLGELNAAEFVARAGNGVAHYRQGQPPPSSPPPPRELMKRLKDAYDPKGALPQLVW